MLDKNKPVKVYRNLHSQTWSIKQGNLVVDHQTFLTLEGATFHVQPAGNAKVLQTGKKNVHAYVKGFLIDVPLTCAGYLSRVGYNPRAGDTAFMNRETNVKVEHAGRVFLLPQGQVYAEGVK